MNFSLLTDFDLRDRKLISRQIYVLRIKMMLHLQYKNLYFCNVSLTIRKTIDCTTLNFIIKYSSKSKYEGVLRSP